MCVKIVCCVVEPLMNFEFVKGILHKCFSNFFPEILDQSRPCWYVKCISCL